MINSEISPLHKFVYATGASSSPFHFRFWLDAEISFFRIDQKSISHFQTLFFDIINYQIHEIYRDNRDKIFISVFYINKMKSRILANKKMDKILSFCIVSFVSN